MKAGESLEQLSKVHFFLWDTSQDFFPPLGKMTRTNIFPGAGSYSSNRSPLIMDSSDDDVEFSPSSPLLLIYNRVFDSCIYLF